MLNARYMAGCDLAVHSFAWLRAIQASMIFITGLGRSQATEWGFLFNCMILYILLINIRLLGRTMLRRRVELGAIQGFSVTASLLNASKVDTSVRSRVMQCHAGL